VRFVRVGWCVRDSWKNTCLCTIASRVEYSLVISRIVLKATTIIRMAPCLKHSLDLLPSSIVKYCLVGRPPTSGYTWMHSPHTSIGGLWCSTASGQTETRMSILRTARSKQTPFFPCGITSDLRHSLPVSGEWLRLTSEQRN